MDKLEVFRGIAAQASHGELVFPTNVNASLKIQQALDDPDCHMETAAKLVAGEPLLAARVVAIANSVAYNRSGNEITSSRAAVMRLGFRTMRALAAAVVVQQFGSKITDPALKKKSEQLWLHTAHVAALSQVMAKKLTNFDADTAMFAAIIHEVGGFYLLSRAGEFPGLLDGNCEEWEEYGEKLIGRGVLKKLGVPETVFEAIEALWFGVRNLPPQTLGDVLLIANVLAPVDSPLEGARSPAEQEERDSLDFAVGNKSLRGVLEDCEEEIESLTASLIS